MQLRCGALLLALTLICQPAIAAEGDAGLEFFETRIRPILVDHCVSCHGPKKQESGLRVDHISFLVGEGNYGTPIVPRQPEKSVLLHAIEHRDPDVRMPDKGERLGDVVVRDFRRWIEMGAPWPKEPVPSGETVRKAFDLEARKRRLPWIWKTPTRSSLPTLREQKHWPTDPIDHFIAAKLEKKGLQLGDRAAPRVWLRRVHFALTGLPPTPADIVAFERDNSPLARERLVDQLLASPRFGERWARHWMDLVRYAESRGHESDFGIANAWRYRDYLIQAYNDDVPYNQFVTEHLAGDLLANPRLHPRTGAHLSVLGTGWAFLGEEVHSPVDIRQDECDRNDNKVDVLSKTFLGLTVGCARCHDHKFDAILQSDYYALAGYIVSSNFRQVRFETMEHNRRVAADLDELTNTTRKSMAKALAKSMRAALDSSWENELANARRDPEHVLHEIAKALDNPDVGKQLRDRWETQAKQARTALDDYRIIADYSDTKTPGLQDGYTFGPRPQRPGDILIGSPENPVLGIATESAAVKDSFWDGLALAPNNEKDSAALAAESRSGRMLRSPKVPLRTGKLFYLLSGESNVYASVDSHLMLRGPLHGHLKRHIRGGRAWHTHDVSVSAGSRVFVQFGAIPGKPLAVSKVVEGDRPPRLVEAPNGDLLALLQTGLTKDTLRSTILTALDRFATDKPLSPGQAQLIAALHTRPGWIDEATRVRISKLARTYHSKREQLRNKVRTHSSTAVAWMDGNGIDENLLIRGKHTRPSEPTARRLPTAFGMPPAPSTSSGRLELARQITDPMNPLSARVYVNRIWHQLFGRGIVETVDNFGYLGSRPTHPELLDHLAWEFVHKDDWSTKRLIRRLVLSETFRLSSETTPQAEQLDPKNLYLSRMPVRRLEAEAIRDSALALSGRLDQRMLGKPVPVHLTEFVIGRGRPGKSGPLDGAGRRSIYTAVRRNFLPTLMLTFDTPTPFSTVGRRNVTNVPAQSLALMNDPFLYQQAKVWAERTLREMPDNTTELKIQRLYLQAFGRTPLDGEVKNCTKALDELARIHGDDEVAVWRDLCHALYSVNDFIYIR